MNKESRIKALEECRVYLLKEVGCSKVISREIAEIDEEIRKLKGEN